MIRACLPRFAAAPSLVALATILAATCAPALADTTATTAPAQPSWDLSVVQAMNHGLASPVTDGVATFLTNRFVTGGAIVLVAAGGTPAYYQTAATGLVAEGVGLGLAEGIKALTDRQRPYLVDPTLRTPAGRETDSSFPSGHTTIAFAAATALALDHPNLAPYGYAFATLVGLSRIYEGVHYPTDVLAGAALGSLTALGVVEGRDALQARGWLPSFGRPASAPLSLTWQF